MDADFGEAFDKNDDRDVDAADRFMQVISHFILLVAIEKSALKTKH